MENENGSEPAGGLASSLECVFGSVCVSWGVAGTYHALVGFFTRVDPHVDQKLVAGVKRLVAADAPSPETGEVLSFALVNMHLFDVPH